MLTFRALLFLLVIGSLATENCHAAVGRTAGSADTNPSGAASYTIPLWTPAGTNGLSPELSLDYSSDKPNGWLGMGFAVSTLSAINRCNRTTAQDGSVNTVPPAFSQFDKFCIDGDRLRLVSGATYGASGTTYQTELESFRKITIMGSDSFGPTWFEVRMPDGLIYEFGNSPDSKIRLINGSGGLSSIRAYWALSRIRDRSNNYIDFTYAQDATRGGYYTQEIRWTGNTNGTAPKYKVTFVNESADRPDRILNRLPYYGGDASQQFDMYKRLSRIDVTYIPTSSIVRSYLLTYAPYAGQGTQSVLQTVQECGVGGADCLSSTNLIFNAVVASTSTTSTGQSLPTGVTPLVMDINGDTRDDLVWPSTSVSGTGIWRYMLASTAGGFSTPVSTAINNTNFTQAQVIEWDGDGKQDLIVPLSANRWWVLRANGSGFDQPFDTGITSTFPTGFADINGDGKDDLVRKLNGLAIRLRSGSSFGAETVALTTPWPVSNIFPINSKRLQDIDGDGMEDLVVMLDQVNATGQHTFLMRTIYGAGNSLRLGLDYGAVTYLGTGDFNADSRVDVAWISGGTIRTSVSPLTGPASSGSQLIVDWDGDRKDDLLIWSSGTWQLARSTGTSFDPLVSSGMTSLTSRTGDFDGDGFSDAVQLNGVALQLVMHTISTPWILRELLQSVTDGFGVTTSFTYGLLSDPLIHTPVAVTGLKEVTLPRPVVRSLTASDGTGTGATYTQTVTYEGAHEDFGGRGFVGFMKRIVRDSRTPNLQTEIKYRQDFPFIEMAYESALRQSPSGTYITRVTNTPLAIVYGSGADVRQYPYVSQSTSDLHEVGGTYDGVKYATKVRTVTAIDSTSGLVTDQVTVTTEIATGLNSASSKTERVYHSSVLNDTSSWCLGLPQLTQEISSHTLAGGSQRTRAVGRTWDPTTCRMNSQSLEPNNAQWEVVTQLGYDGFGNINSQSVTGAGMTARITLVNWGPAGQFPETITNALSQQTHQSFRYDLGVESSTTDSNGLTTSWGTDNYGRRNLETRPDGTKTVTTLFSCTVGCDPRVKVYASVETKAVNNSVVRTDWAYFDRFNRMVFEHAQRPGGAFAINGVEFDSLGRTARRYNPWWNGAGQNGYWGIEYDALNRVTAEKLFTSAGAINRSRAQSFNGLSASVGDYKGNSSTHYSSAWGDLVQITDAVAGATKYKSNAFGQTVEIKDAYDNITTEIAYNVRGMKVSSTDLDMGLWEFLPNALGEVTKVRDAKTSSPNWTTQFYYDAIGRMTQRDEAEGSTVWTWGSSALDHNINQLYSVVGPGYSEYLTYDDKARIAQRSITTDTNYQIDFSYQTQTGLLETMTYPMSTSNYRFKIQYEYEYGDLSKIKRFDAPNTVYWKLNALDARGNVLDEILGNGIQVVSGYDALTGFLDYRSAGPSAGTTIQNLDYDWDLNGNLSKRKDVRQGNLEEVFTYDALNRVTASTLNGTPNLSVAYDLIGNITNKDGTAYTYHSTKKHAVVAAGGNAYSYDANGNAATKNGNAITWTSYNYPSGIAGGGVSSQFWYGPDRERYKQVGNYTGGATETTHYVGGILEKLVTSTRTHFKHYVSGPNGAVATYTRRTDATEDTFYFTSDHIGSIDSVTNQAGAVQVRLSYDAFGKRRKEAGWNGAVPTADLTGIANTTRHGFTEHEFLDNLGLIHMNGRVQDPTIGRFLSADPFVQDPTNAQSLNRYTYAWNNPLTLVDPSGFLADAGDNGGSPTSREDNMGEDIVVVGIAPCDSTCSDARTNQWAMGTVNFVSPSAPTITNAGPTVTSVDEIVDTIEVTKPKIVKRVKTYGAVSPRIFVEFYVISIGSAVAAVVAVEAGAVAAVRYTYRIVWINGKKFVKNISVDGPSPGVWFANGRIFGLRWKESQWGIRLDLHPMKGDPTNTPVLHLNIGPPGRGEAGHLTLFNPNWFKWGN